MLRTHYRIGQAAGVSINLQSNGNTLIHASSIIVKDSKLDFENKAINLTDIQELKKHLPQKTHVSLNLFGKGILLKQVARLDEVNSAVFSQILPNGNPDDFYTQHFISGDSSFVSIIRKAEADKWIEAIEDLGFTPLLLSLGAFPAHHVIEQLNFYDDELVFDGHLVKQNAIKEWIDYKYTAGSSAGFPVKIGSEVIDEKIVLPYAAAFQLALSPDIAPVQANVDTLASQFEDVLSNKKLRVKGFIVLVVCFVLLLINFLVFSWLNSENNLLSEQINVSARSLTDVEGINDQVVEKEALLKSLGWDEGLNKAMMLDQLAALVPDEIRLLEMAINPIDPSTTREKRSLSFSDRTVKVSGSSENIIPMNEWIARIKTLKWVKTIQMDRYAFNSELGTGQFIITITY
jgi:Tfp pilus assembly protein PilN